VRVVLRHSTAAKNFRAGRSRPFRPRLARGRAAVGVLALLAIGSLLGCGGGNRRENRADGQVGRPAPLLGAAKPNRQHQSKRAFIHQANDICKRLISTAEATRRRYLFNSDPVVVQRGFAELAREVGTGLGEIKALLQPRSGERALGRLYRAAEAGARQLARAAVNRQAAQQVLAGDDPFAKTALLARAYGLTSCQEPVG
jgi:hypothetical protein